MSEGYLYRHACQLLQSCDVSEPMRSDAYTVLRAADPGALTFVLHALSDAGPVSDEACLRGAAVFIQFAATNLTDDLADGDCDYLEPAYKVGPVVQYFLQNLFLRALGQAKIPAGVLAEVGLDLMRAAEAENVDVQCRADWNLERAQEVARGTSGLQYSGYLRVLWSGTALEPLASDVGTRLGSAAHVVTDVADDDLRYTSLSHDERGKLLDWAESALDSTCWPPLRCADTVVGSLKPAIARARLVLLNQHS